MTPPMTLEADSALLNQILNTLTTLGERLAVVEADLKTVIRDHTKDLDDHEGRIRLLEATGRELVTHADITAMEERRAAEVAAALVATERRSSRKFVIAGLALTAVSIIINGAFQLIA